jgi:hypothetical protein
LGIQSSFRRDKSTVNKQKDKIMIHSSIENVKPEQVTNNEQNADNQQVSPSIANAMLSVVYPDKVKLQNEYLVNYGKEFLRINCLKVGDEIELEFPYEFVRQKYKSREMEKYSGKKIGKGILKLDDAGRLYAESLDDFVFYNHTSNGYTGRSRRSWYEEVRKKSVIRFGTGFVF